MSITVEEREELSSHLLEKSHPLSAMLLRHCNTLFFSERSVIFATVAESSLNDSGLAVVVFALYWLTLKLVPPIWKVVACVLSQ